MPKPEKTREDLLEEISALKEQNALLCSILENIPGWSASASPEGIVCPLPQIPTRRKQAEEERVTLAALVEHSNDFIALASLEGIVSYLNPAGQRMVGLTELERVKEKKSLLVFVPERERPSLRSQFAQLLQGKRIQGETWMRHFQTHKTIPVEFTSFTILPEDGGPPLGIALVARDTTGHKQADEERERLLVQERAQRERVAFLSEASRALSLSLNYLTTLRLLAELTVPQLASTTVIDLVDERGELGPNHPVLIASDDPEEERWMREIFRRYPTRPAHPVMQVMKSGRAMLLTPEHNAPLAEIAWDEEHLRLLRQLWPLSAVLVPLEARGQRFGVLALMTKERVYNEEDLALVEELGVRAALAIDNARLYQDANNAIRARDEFLYIASHELKTPLTPLWLRLQMLLRLKRKGGDEKRFSQEVLSQLEGMQKQILRLRRLIDELLDFSRVAEGRLTLEVEEVDLTSLMREVLERCGEEMRRAGSTLTLDAPGPLTGRWDRLRLDQILTNLVSNAIKYGQGNPIEILLEADDAQARVKVQDHGLGIAPKDQERIFDRFERAVSERHYGGLGLGLWIARQLAEAAGGSISVTSQPGQGSLFTLILPR